MKLLKLAGLSVCAGIAAISADVATSSFTSPATAQVNLQSVLDAVRVERRKSAEENSRREAEFLAKRNEQRAELSRVKARKDAAKAETLRLEGLRDGNRATIADLSTKLDEANGEFRDLFGAARSAANDLNNTIETSLISAQFPGRGDALLKTAQSEKLPAIEELEYLWDTYMLEMVEQGKVATFDAPILDVKGNPSSATVTRIGPFVAFSNGEFLVYEKNDQGSVSLKKLTRQPTGNRKGLASNVENSSGGNHVRGIIDPSLGALLALTVEEPTLKERLDQGGPVGYTIVAMTVLGVAFGFFRLVMLILTNGAVRAQARSKKISKSNPLGRVMMAYEATDKADTDTVALRLDDAVLKEIPKLEGGLNFIKVLAAVAPLLGLLGTVIGMIQTFQAITLFGTGDPQIMAGGISAALVTTVLGLIGAIPLLFIHAFASGAAKGVTQTLEEKAAGIIAGHAEGHRG